MSSFKNLNNILGWLVFAVTGLVLCAAAEPTGSLWDCGEFVSGAYKLQVVHPPGAPFFLVVGRLFAWVGSLVSANPEAVAYSVNMLSALCTAFGAMFICWSTVILAKLALVGRDEEMDKGQSIAVLMAGLVAGLTTAFTSSVWFSAVEGEVYSMSAFFTCLVLWAMLKWYNLPDRAENDKWIVFALYAVALSIGVHLLSLLTLPALAMFYYFKKSKQPTWKGALLAGVVGVAFIVGIQAIIITGLPNMMASFDRTLVGMGLPFNSGIALVLAIFSGAIWFGLRYARRTGNGLVQKLVVSLGVMVIAYLCYGMVIIRSNANPPINMNAPTDPVRLLPYLNREQYGDRPLLYGAHFDAKPLDLKIEDRYGRVGNEYKIVDQKVDYEYNDADKTLFPRMGDYSQGRPKLYRAWIDKPSGTPNFADNLKFFFKYQIGWMYWRYFMWNFSGRQNGDQGYYAWDPSAGNWISGFTALDEQRLGSESQLTERMKSDPARNKYYMIPFFLGLLGLFFHANRKKRDFVALFSLFLITGLGLIVYSNEPPNEPRERDYVLAGSFFTYAIWIGMSVLAIYDLLKKAIGSVPAGALGGVLALAAPILMVTQNWDDHSRAKHYASRDYASNFLNSCEPNAIIFTYGDNDTYPLWYAQEVENIRTDVRVVNLSLIAVDWYIDQMRRKVNNSAPIKLSIPSEAIQGFKRVQIPYYAPSGERKMTLGQALTYMGENHPLPTQGQGRDFDSHLPSRQLFIPVNKTDVFKYGVVSQKDSAAVVDTISFQIGEGKAQYITKDDLAVLDVISSNIWERPIYFAVTCRDEKLMGLQDYLQLEGLGLRLVPIKSKSQTAQYGIIGAGRVNTDAAFKNMTEKWRWGNFDKEKMYIDRSYQPSIQTMRVSFIRVARELMQQGDKVRAVALVDKYFEAFPSFNFSYDNFTSYLVQLYVQAGENEKAKARIIDIAKDYEANLKYFDSLDKETLKAGYQSEFQNMVSGKEALIDLAKSMKDEELVKQLEAQFSAWSVAPQDFPGR